MSFLTRFSAMLSSTLTGTTFGLLCAHQNYNIGDVIVPLLLTPVLGISSLTSLCIIAGAANPVVTGYGIIGFVLGTIGGIKA
jgi:hypothetical protein